MGGLVCLTALCPMSNEGVFEYQVSSLRFTIDGSVACEQFKTSCRLPPLSCPSLQPARSVRSFLIHNWGSSPGARQITARWRPYNMQFFIILSTSNTHEI